MNHAYRLVWSDASQSYVPVPEFARARGKRKTAAVLLTAAAALGVAGSACALAPDALPTNPRLVGGQAVVTQTGAAMTVQQASARAAIDWQSFNIGAGASVTFVQPSASAIALNRVVGQDPSQILGSLSANGQVFVVNPAGVLFGQGAQVNAQGIVASTRNISVADFMAGRTVFSGVENSQVVNQGNLIAADGGYVALIGAQVKNLGEIHAPRGDVRLAAADRVTVTLDNGSLAGFTVDRGTLDALAENGGLIKADGGRVYLTADAADLLAKAVVNNSGVIEARGTENRNGTIVLLADMNAGTAHVAGTLDASRTDGTKGGFVETSGHTVNVADGARIKAGRWLIDPADFTVAASGGNMTGAAVSTALAGGDLEIQSSTGTAGGNGDIHINDAVSWSANTLTLTAARDVNINAVMTASGTAALALNTGTANGADTGVAGGTVKVGFAPGGTFKGRVDFDRAGTGFLTINGEGYTVINSLGTEGVTNTGTDLQGMAGNLAGRYVLGANIDASATATWNSNQGFAPIGNSTTPFTGIFDGLGHTIAGLTINTPSVHYIGLFGFSQGTLRNVGLAGGSVLGNAYVGALAGQSAGTVANSYATANVRSTSYFVGGLVGWNNGSIVDSHAGGGVLGIIHIGGLVGHNDTDARILRSYAEGNVVSDYGTDSTHVGGLSGTNAGTIEFSYATGNVSLTVGHTTSAGGLVGTNYNTIHDSYATGNVWMQSTSSKGGGLVGTNEGSITNSYASGSVTGTSGTLFGGLVGFNAGSVSNSFWNSEISGMATSAGGTGITTAQSRQLTTFANAGWDINAAGGTGKAWRIYEGDSGPLLRSFLTPITIGGASSDSRTYDRTLYSGGNGNRFTIPGASSAFLLDGGSAQGARNAGSYTLTVYSGQKGYDLVGTRSTTVDITPLALTVTGATAASKVYDGTTAAAITGGTLSGILSGDTLELSQNGSFANKNAGAGKAVALALSGADAGNYTVAGTLTADITPLAITVSGATAANKVYDGTTAAVTGGTLSGILGGDTVALSGTFNDKNVGTGKAVTLGLSGVDAGNYTWAGASGTADITPKTLNVTYTGVNKAYDGTTAATINTAGATYAGLVAGDNLTVSAAGAFADKQAGTGKTVTVSGVTLSGADAGNYSVAATGTATADITPRVLTVALAGPVSKTADGNADATLVPANYVVGNVVAGESVAVTRTAGRYGDPAPGTGKTVTATLAAADYAAGNGTRLANYRLATGDVAGAVGEIRAAPSNGTPATGYAGALATVTQPPAAGSPAAMPPAPALGNAAPATGSTSAPAPDNLPTGATVVLLANAQGLPMPSMHIIDGGIRLPDHATYQEGR